MGWRQAIESPFMSWAMAGTFEIQYITPWSRKLPSRMPPIAQPCDSDTRAMARSRT